MKYFINLILILFMISCKIDSKHQKLNTEVDLAGTWKLIAVDDDKTHNNQRLIITKDSTYHMFSYSNGGGFIEQGSISKFDSLTSYQNVTSKLIRIDSTKIKIIQYHGIFGDYIKTYEKSNYEKDVQELAKRDSLRKKALGWWKVSKSKLPIQLVNYSRRYNTFTLQIKANGVAYFYLENYLDSVVSYDYRIEENAIDFRRGDVMGGGTQLFFESDSIMKMLMTKRSTDTLELKRLYKIE